MRRSSSTAVRRFAGATLALVALAAASGACGDPPPDPSVAPIEIVAGSRARPGSPCLLNRPSVEAGTHELVAIAESAPAVVQLQDDQGVTIFDEAVEQGGTTSATVVLDPGPHIVSCSVGDRPSVTIPLEVDDRKE